MQYIRRRILRVSGVTVRDEHLERRDFSTASTREEWDDFLARKSDPGIRVERKPMADWGAARERT